MLKVIPPGSFDFGDAVSSRIKVSSSGLRGSDLSVFTKRAGHELADVVKRMTFAPGEVPIHLIAMGAVESSGFNRNCDGWKADTLRKDHHTFQKFARFFRNHKSDNPQISYGIVKKSYFNPEMLRVELIVALNGTKEAADRNNGLVADEEIDVLEKGAELSVSMASICGFDLCSGCGHRAKTRRQYCDETTCKYGGLKKNAGKVFENGLALYADTYENKFKDISKVWRPADRTAYVLGKVASANDHVVSGAELAELWGLSVPDLEDGPAAHGSHLLQRLKIARELAARAEALQDSPWQRAADPVARPLIQDLHKVAAHERQPALQALALCGVLLNVDEWLSLTTGEPITKCAAAAANVKPHLDNVLQSFADDAQDVLGNAMFQRGQPALHLQKWAAQYRQSHGLHQEAAQRRVWLSAMTNPHFACDFRKAAGAPTQAAQHIANHYLAYAVEFLSSQAEFLHTPLTRDLVVLQNRS